LQFSANAAIPDAGAPAAILRRKVAKSDERPFAESHPDTFELIEWLTGASESVVEWQRWVKSVDSVMSEMSPLILQ
jgi:hypothetical protein